MAKFEKGQTRLPSAGRLKGSPNKLTVDVREMIRGALEDAGGRKYLLEQAQLNPVAFMSLVGKILPKEINVDLIADIHLIKHVVVDVHDSATLID